MALKKCSSLDTIVTIKSIFISNQIILIPRKSVWAEISKISKFPVHFVKISKSFLSFLKKNHNRFWGTNISESVLQYKAERASQSSLVKTQKQQFPKLQKMGWIPFWRSIITFFKTSSWSRLKLSFRLKASPKKPIEINKKHCPMKSSQNHQKYCQS